jgi:hypothetical protein
MKHEIAIGIATEVDVVQLVRQQAIHAENAKVCNSSFALTTTYRAVQAIKMHSFSSEQ